MKTSNLLEVNQSLLDAARPAAKWMRWWLEQDVCDCEDGHQCGRPDRRRELEDLELAISQAQKHENQTRNHH